MIDDTPTEPKGRALRMRMRTKVALIFMAGVSFSDKCTLNNNYSIIIILCQVIYHCKYTIIIIIIKYHTLSLFTHNVMYNYYAISYDTMKFANSTELIVENSLFPPATMSSLVVGRATAKQRRLATDI